MARAGGGGGGGLRLHFYLTGGSQMVKKNIWKFVQIGKTNTQGRVQSLILTVNTINSLSIDVNGDKVDVRVVLVDIANVYVGTIQQFGGPVDGENHRLPALNKKKLK